MRPAFYVLLGVLLVPTVGLVGDIVTDGKFTSTMSTGAPMEVASSDMVANLNADMVDGVEGTDIYTKAEVDALIAAAATADSRRAFYVTTTAHTGSEALTACDTGFHMASMWEIHDVSTLRYDVTRGFVRDDSGSGPPSSLVGWIRTGWNGHTDSSAGSSNCGAWSSDSDAHAGTGVDLPTSWDDASLRVAPWAAGAYSCDLAIRVWCVED